MAIGRRCDLGCETWPDDVRFRVCPECSEKTTRYSDVRPISLNEALPRLFEWFYNEWDRRMPASRLQMTPEEALKWNALYPDGRPNSPPAKSN